MSRMKLIVNPTSGQEEAIANLADVNERLRRAFDHVDIALTATEGDHEREAARAAAEGCTHVVAVGGDGTLNGVLNGVASSVGSLDRIILGVIPAGTGNDFARGLGLPDDPVEAAERLATQHTVRIDVGVLNDRYFVNTSAGGLVAETSIRVDSGMKTLAGRFAYLLGGVQTLLDYEPVHLRVHVPGQDVADTLMQAFVVSNSPYIGGGYRIAPEARLDDGLLDVSIIRTASMLRLLPALRRFAQGERLDEEEALYVRAPEFEIECDRDVWVNTDGEPLEGRRFRYRVLRQAATFLA